MAAEITGSPGPIRPPWALPEARFLSTCTQCAECVKICPEKILVKGVDGYPQVSFDSRGCTFCGKCVVVCNDNALYRTRSARPWSLTLNFSDNCLSAQGLTCRVCADVCVPQAISFAEADTGWPAVAMELCTGCGNCVNPCPVQAISLARA